MPLDAPVIKASLGTEIPPTEVQHGVAPRVRDDMGCNHAGRRIDLVCEPAVDTAVIA
jgi:hypothetical protein